MSGKPSVSKLVDELHRLGLARLKELLEGAEIRKGEIAVIKAISQCWVYTKRYGLGEDEEPRERLTEEERADIRAKVAEALGKDRSSFARTELESEP